MSSEILKKWTSAFTLKHPRTPPRELYKRNIQYQNRVKSLMNIRDHTCITFNSSTIFEIGLCEYDYFS